jgi:pseudouridine-5'-phosphate glycosidase/pseudouridine kinase
METNTAMREWWWSVIGDLELGQDYQSQLAILARQTISTSLAADDKSNGTLDFLLERGIARMAVQLLPFFQCSIIKCGKAGN